MVLFLRAHSLLASRSSRPTHPRPWPLPPPRVATAEPDGTNSLEPLFPVPSENQSAASITENSSIFSDQATDLRAQEADKRVIDPLQAEDTSESPPPSDHIESSLDSKDSGINVSAPEHFRPQQLFFYLDAGSTLRRRCCRCPSTSCC
jgi:hypothetical protein